MGHRTSRVNWALVLPVFCLGWLSETPARAVDADFTPDATASGLEEIVVTAQRRNEDQEKTPVAVTVLSADELAQASVVSEQDLRSATPGLSVRGTINSNQLNYSLRGQSQDAYSGTKPGVLPYVNDVQISGTGGASAFYDLQSVQVLKGPQGTLFGRSATGGAVLFTTAKPTDTLSGYVDAAGGNYADKRFEGAVSGPLLGEQVLGRIAGFYEKHDGYQYNLYDDQTVGGTRRAAIRGTLSVRVTDGIVNDLVVEYENDDSQSTVAVLAGLLPFAGGGPGNPPYIPLTLLYAGTATPLARATGTAVLSSFLPPAAQPLAAAFYNHYFTLPGHDPAGLAGFLSTQQARGPYTIDVDADNAYRNNRILFTDTATFTLNDDTQIRNILGLLNDRTFLANDTDGTSYGISGTPGGGYLLHAKTISEELQLVGHAFAERLSYVGGLYYSNEKHHNVEGAQFFDILLGGETVLNDYQLEDTTYAAYAQGTYQLNDNGLGLTLGVRETHEKVSANELSDDTNYGFAAEFPGVYLNDQSKTYPQLSWQVGLQDQVTDQELLYVVSRRAFKAGGFNGDVAPKVGYADSAGNAYRQEQVTDIELGSKFQGRLWNIPTRFNVALYHDWVDEGQRTAFTLVGSSPSSLTVNVPRGTVYGLELEGEIRPIQWLTVGASFNYTHAEFTPGENTVYAAGAPAVFDQVPDTPKLSGAVFGDVSIPVSSNLAVTLHGDMYSQSVSYTAPQSVNSYGTKMAGYALADFRIALEDKTAGWTVSVLVKNAFDRIYYVGGLPLGEIDQLNTLIPGVPRTVVAEGRWKF